MALSDYEKQVIAEMEKQLKKADPSLASVMMSSLPDSKVKAGSGGRLSPRRVAIGSILTVVGLSTVLFGVTMGFGIWAVLLGALGFILMVGGILFALKTDQKKMKMTGTTPKVKNKKKFMDGQAERWENRDS